MIKEIRCQVCSQVFELEDQVVLDILNGLHHKYCFENTIPLKDFGTFEVMIQHYDFFHDILPMN